MKASLRNIANGLLIAGVFAVVFANVSSLLTCGSGSNCSVASAIFGIPEYSLTFEPELGSAVSTAAVSEAVRGAPLSAGEVSGVVGVYLLTIAVIVLGLLEVLELYYIRKLLGPKFKLRFR